jgi:mannose-6-phosphate isomerase class I
LSPHTPTFGQDVIPEIRLPDRGEEEDVVSGWPKLARLMIATPEFESFCRFRELNVKTLLYYQVELAQLEQKLKKVEKRDSGRRDSDEGKYAKFAVNMIPRNDNPNDSATPKQWRLIKKIRKVLKEYSKANRRPELQTMYQC